MFKPVLRTYFLILCPLVIAAFPKAACAQEAFSSNQADAFWSTLEATGDVNERHENGFIAYGDKLYLIGGRSLKPVQIFDLATQTWSDGAYPPFQMHHFQALVYNDLIYVIGAYTGTCCDSETGIEHVWTYNPQTDDWSQGHEIPVDRRRGSTGAVVYNNKIYIVGGLEGGHGAPATSFNWFDEYDPATGQWKVLPNAPRTRDHFHAVVYRDKLYLIGGRDTSDPSFVNLTRTEIDVYDFATSTWTTMSPSLPTPRGGAATLLYGSEILVIGGESASQTLAHNETEAFNPDDETWRTLAPLNVGRHGTQATLLDNTIYIGAGAAQRGGSPELDSIEKFEDTDIQLLTHSQSFFPGWNMAGLPLAPLDNFYSSVYDDVDFSSGRLPVNWDGAAYQQATQLNTGKAYWFKLDDDLPGSETQVVEGTFVNSIQVPLLQGWNMITGPSCDNVPLTSSSTNPNGAIEERMTFYFDQGGYREAFSPSNTRGLLQRGVGYWVFANFNATLSLSCTTSASKLPALATAARSNVEATFGSITVNDSNAGRRSLYFGHRLHDARSLDQYLLPPRAPEGAFDVRFTDNRRLSESDETFVRIQASAYPLHIHFDRSPSGREGIIELEELDRSFTLQRRHSLPLHGQLALRDPSTRYLRLSFSATDNGKLPDRFVLHGNYPNPFNPSTNILFDLPLAGEVSLRVFDMLGKERVRETYSNVQAGINRSIQFDAESLPAGTYVYRLTSRSGSQSTTQTGTLVLLK